MNHNYEYLLLKYESLFYRKKITSSIFFFCKASANDCSNLCKELQSRIQIIERQQTSNTNTPVCLIYLEKKFIFYLINFRQKVVIQVHHLMLLFLMIHHLLKKFYQLVVLVNDLVPIVILIHQRKQMIFRKNQSRLIIM
jgi:hypothetical protein